MKAFLPFAALLAASLAHAGDRGLALAGGGRSLEQVVFVCEKDLRARHLRRTDLLPGVVAVDGADVWENGKPLSADRKLRRICS